MKYEAFAKMIEDKVGERPKRLEVSYNESDSRCWTAIIGKNSQNVLVTYHVNKGEHGNRCFDVISTRNPILNISESEILDTISELI